jgi:hypothetical protein
MNKKDVVGNSLKRVHSVNTGRGTGQPNFTCFFWENPLKHLGAKNV